MHINKRKKRALFVLGYIVAVLIISIFNAEAGATLILLMPVLATIWLIYFIISILRKRIVNQNITVQEKVPEKPKEVVSHNIKASEKAPVKPTVTFYPQNPVVKTTDKSEEKDVTRTPDNKNIDSIILNSKIEPVTNISKYDYKKSPTIHKLRKKLYDFVVFDIETTGLSRIQNDIIQISAIKVKDDKIVDKFNSFINPGYALDEKIIYLTGITDKDLENAPKIDNVMSEFKQFVEQLPLVGHNIVKFDVPFIQSNGFDLEDVSVIDTWRLARQKEFTSPIENLKLPTLKKYYGLFNRSHNALNDCETNLIVYQNLRDDNLDKVDIDISEIPQTLTGKRISITGEFIETSRNDLIDAIRHHGGRYTKAVSGRTDYLIDGKQISDRLKDGIHSSNELKAMELQKNGGKIKIINYSDFENLLEPEQSVLAM